MYFWKPKGENSLKRKKSLFQLEACTLTAGHLFGKLWTQSDTWQTRRLTRTPAAEKLTKQIHNYKHKYNISIHQSNAHCTLQTLKTDHEVHKSSLDYHPHPTLVATTHTHIYIWTRYGFSCMINITLVLLLVYQLSCFWSLQEAPHSIVDEATGKKIACTHITVLKTLTLEQSRKMSTS